MHKVNISEFRKEVLAVLDENRGKVTKFDAKSDYSIIAFEGKNFICEVTLDNKWIGYDFAIDLPEEYIECRLENDSNNCSVYDKKYEKFIINLFEDLLKTVRAIFEGNIYYQSDEKRSYVAMKNDDGTYYVMCREKKDFLSIPYKSCWIKEKYSKSEFDKLKLKALS